MKNAEKVSNQQRSHFFFLQNFFIQVKSLVCVNCSLFCSLLDISVCKTCSCFRGRLKYIFLKHRHEYIREKSNILMYKNFNSSVNKKLLSIITQIYYNQQILRFDCYRSRQSSIVKINEYIHQL